ncbi:hypothetical protein HBH56_100600 [Parastagonospora nodorum]|uniref:DUF7708 domain-containing protein n=1 Tax=Phaeosphaeria nodorum (strain SN15 / ATCC MYA-4574 / FGSC 10173) TaxID=321614 RepID=A0A7U2ICW1_PHANO|nr:hypothetical protein HBH56_100600 [Parastagonospora nodorum]QRD07537.1 hypothetical protein JI435_308630 [Parastagonospora nodorum SN15]KAH3930572.1 hypothetical protein HBH54_114920 [Parastagonospora nodorum]KAH3942825.1 hypothetical protein HBH53_180880 [Parastagonospora nodorum]KAH4051047.1 hypothetical protein HBH49_127060 [Parastagonospora nodorum]
MEFQQKKLSEEWIGSSGTTRTGTSAAEMYKLAILQFGSDMTQNERKVDLATHTGSLQNLEDVVKIAQKDYESSRNKKARKWLERFSSRLIYYGNIFDILAQHHPEYVALAWGAMKFLFVAFLNHQGVIASISKGLARIADALPRVELATTLYPTTRMTDVVEVLYAQVIQFLIRAHDWYREGTLRHIVHSVTRPAELRYQDLLESIEASSRTIEKLAISGSQVELRQMHTILETMADRVEKSESTILEMRSMMINHQSINSSSLLDTNGKVSDLQFSEMVRITAEPSSFDPVESYNHAVVIRNLRRQNQRMNIPRTFWQSPTLKKFADSRISSMMFVKGTFQERAMLRDTAVRVTEELKRKNIPTLWAVKSRMPDSASKTPTPVDFLKSLVAQALTLDTSSHSQKSTSLSCTQLRTAATERQWIDILGAALANLYRETYVVLELDVLLSHSSENSSNSEVITLFADMLKELTIRGEKSIIKVLIVTSRTLLRLPQATDNILIHAIPSGHSLRVKQPLKQQRKRDITSSYRTTPKMWRREAR